MRINHRVFGAFCVAVALLAGSTGYGQDCSNNCCQQRDCDRWLVPVNYNPATCEYTTSPVLTYSVSDLTSTCSEEQPSTGSELGVPAPDMLLDDAPSFGESFDQSFDQSCGQSCGCCSPYPRWSGLVESLWFQRTKADRFPLTFPGSNDPDIMSTRNQNFGTANGYRATLAKAFAHSPCTYKEVSFMGIDDWGGVSRVQAQGGPPFNLDAFLRTGFINALNLEQFRNAFSQTATADTRLYSAEFNARRYFYPSDVCTASVLAGFRYIHIEDDFRFLSNDTPAGGDFGLYTVDTKNNLVGGQIGGSLERQLSCNFSAGFKLKTGIFANFNEQKGHLLNVPNPANPPTVDLRSQDTGTSLSAMVETGLFADYQFSPHFGVRGGYDVFIISGLALTANQLDFTGNQFQGHPYINNSSSLVFYGPTVGLWATW